MKKIDYLIDYLMKENNNIDIKKNPKNMNEKKKIYRSLCNIRKPMPISKEYIKKENEFLKEEIKKKGIIDSKEIISFMNYEDTKICLWQGDITTLNIEAIVNAANSQGLGCFIPCHSCIDNAIHSFSGIELRLECNKKMQEIGILETGKVFITDAYNLPSKYIIHTVGPIIYDEVTKKEEEKLSNCYINCLKVAEKNNIKTIAFPCISTGEFRFPKDLASKIAIETIKKYLKVRTGCFEKIVLNVFSNEDYDIYLKNLGEEYEESL